MPTASIALSPRKTNSCPSQTSPGNWGLEGKVSGSQQPQV